MFNALLKDQPDFVWFILTRGFATEAATSQTCQWELEAFLTAETLAELYKRVCITFQKRQDCLMVRFINGQVILLVGQAGRNHLPSSVRPSAPASLLPVLKDEDCDNIRSNSSFTLAKHCLPGCFSY